MKTTECFCIPYDTEKLSAEQQQELEEYCQELFYMLENKIKSMGLIIVKGVFGNYITKLTEEELKQSERRCRLERI